MFGESSLKDATHNIVSNPDWFTVVQPSDGSVTTHQISSGAFKLGISDKGGGYINQLILPGKGDVMGPETDRFGRGGQSSIRDVMHGGRYNPTQAGFSDQAGTVCKVVASQDGSKLTVVPRPCCLFRGDNKFDFTEWENLANDNYRERGTEKDWDTIDESKLPGKQATEVTSEFDYFCTYEDQLGSTGLTFEGTDEITIPTIRHYYEYRYVRDPGHCILQHVKGPLFNPKAGAVTDLSVANPTGVHKAGANDMSIVTFSMSIRMDRSIWSPKYMGIVDGPNLDDLRFSARSDKASAYQFHNNPELAERLTGYKVKKSDSIQAPLYILSDSTDMDQEGALGLYYPNSEINECSVIGVDRLDGSVAYKEDRRLYVKLLDTPQRTSKMQWCGFRGQVLGILNPLRLPANQYEAFRGEFYLLYGSPREIINNAQRIQTF